MWLHWARLLILLQLGLLLAAKTGTGPDWSTLARLIAAPLP